MPSFTSFAVAAAALQYGAQAVTPLAKPVPKQDYYVSLGPRPYFLINNMTDSPLKTKLQSCENGPFQITDFSIGHRGGGTLQFPEETVESEMAGARMGAGVLECDVSFTKDRGLVCRHSLCDLHTTTNILLNSTLAAKCTKRFTPANGTAPADALCCTSDITIAEYQTLCGKQDGFNASAKTVQDYQFGTPNWRTELYDTCGTVLTLDSYITLVDSLPGYRNFTPELKTPPAQVPMPFNGYTQQQYARDMLNKFIQRGINPDRVWAQSFLPADIYQWIAEFPQFGKQAIYLDESGDDPANYTLAVAALPSIRAQGVNIISPPINYLLTLTPDNKYIIPSLYANASKAAGLDIIAWTYERSGPLATVKSRGEYYFQSLVNKTGGLQDGDYMVALDVLANKIGIKGLFSDWSATVTYFANCFNLTGPNASDYKARGPASASSSATTLRTSTVTSTTVRPSTTASASATTARTSTSSVTTVRTSTTMATSTSRAATTTTTMAASQISDGQVQAPSATKMVQQISDGQVQNRPS